ncbi:MAG UNVERIFIED_CONTAM: hypothetical protein LVR18_34845 [Planctomycetaceae bacterium]
MVLGPDAAGFGERNGLQQPGGGQLRGRELEQYLFATQVVAGRSLAWQNISDMRRAVSLLAGFEFVQSERLGCYGHSMGSTHTWLVGPFEPRLRALAGNCCLPTYGAMERTGLMHCFPNYIPGWRQYGDLPDIACADRPLRTAPEFRRTGQRQPDCRSASRTARTAAGLDLQPASPKIFPGLSKAIPTTSSARKCGAGSEITSAATSGETRQGAGENLAREICRIPATCRTLAVDVPQHALPACNFIQP